MKRTNNDNPTGAASRLRPGFFRPVRRSGFVWLLFAALLFALIFPLTGCGTTANEGEIMADSGSTSAPEPKDTRPEPKDTRTPAEKLADETLASMSLDEKIAQLFIVTPESLTGYDTVTQFGDTSKKALQKNPVGGLVYFSQNLSSVSQTKEMLSGTQDYAKESGMVPLFLAVDEEGGDVARCVDNLHTTSFSPMYTYREQGAKTARENASVIASDITDLGFNLDFAPIADVWSNPANQVIGTRAYSDDCKEAAVLVAAAVEGFHDGGAACTLKHFPGHGNTKEDSHEDFAYSDRTSEELQEGELLPFVSGMDAGADMIMSGHITLTAIDPDHPASLSGTLIRQLLREELGYDGVIVTDALNMGAVSNHYDSAQAAVLALSAGNDMLLAPADLSDAIEGIKNAVSDGTLNEERIDESVRRILILKAERGILIP